MKFARVCLALFLILSLLVFAVPISARDKAEDGKYAADRILVKFKEGTGAVAKQKAHSRNGGKVIGEIASLDVQVVQVPADNVNEKVKEYQAVGSVEYAEPDYILTALEIPDDPGFNGQWGLNNVGQTGGTKDADIDAPEAWDVATSTPSIKVAVLDTGVDQNHEDLAQKIAANNNFTTSTTVDDLYGHGTHVAGIAAAATNNGIGVAGVGYSASVMNVKVLGDDGSGYSSWIANGIKWAADSGAKVINMSLGSSVRSSTIENAVNYAWNKGVIIVAAAGNNGSQGKVYPAAYDKCIAVAASDHYDDKAYFSNYGKWVDIAAPGQSIYSTMPNHNNTIGKLDYGTLSGTSMATPHVAGVAALVWSTNYGTSATAVRNRIQDTADKPTSGNIYAKYGIKRANADKAVR